MDYAGLFSGIPGWLATALTAMLPIGELRTAIPLGLTTFDLSIPSAYGWSVVGNLVPIIFLLPALEPLSRWLSRHSRLFARFFAWLFARTRRRHEASFERWGALALVLFVAIPLPVTGAWTGTVAAFVFGIPLRRSFVLITLGVLIAGAIVTAITVSALSIF